MRRGMDTINVNSESGAFADVLALSEGGELLGCKPGGCCHFIERRPNDPRRYRRSGNGTGHDFPMRHGADTMNASGESGASVTWGDEEISDGGEDCYETLQPSG